MNMDLKTLAGIVEKHIPKARCVCVPGENQLVVSFSDRTDVEVALLTPYLQSMIKQGSIESEDLFDIIQSVRSIADFTPGAL